MGYCVRKIGDLSDGNEDDLQDLNLRRSHSTVDEDSMASILVKILQLLVGELENARIRLDHAETIEAKTLRNYSELQNKLDSTMDSIAGYLTQAKGMNIGLTNDTIDRFVLNYLEAEEKFETSVQRVDVLKLCEIDPDSIKKMETTKSMKPVTEKPEVDKPDSKMGSALGGLFGDDSDKEEEEEENEDEE
jgi:hypothetical protein